ncbi:MAG: hypothetical protein HY547_06385 [Elusimicrobia bacterium]|nr:hypothetical protein [Elusimicrobiota bacterium]
MTRSQNALDGSTIENGSLGVTDRGIWLYRCGYLTIKDIMFGGYANSPTNGVFIDIGTNNTLTIMATQGETGSYTGWRHIRIGNPSSYSPINLISNIFDLDVQVNANRLINSFGNSYGVKNFEMNGDDVQVVSMGDYFSTGGFTGTGVNRHVTRIGTYDNTSGLAARFQHLVSGTSKEIFKDDGSVGIGTSAPGAKLHVSGGNMYTSTAGNGLIVKSPDGATCKIIGIDNAGAVTTTAIACP